MKKITYIFVASILMLSYSLIFSAHSLNSLKLNKYGSIYDSPANNVTLTVEPFAANQSKALIKVQGVQSKLDGVIMIANVQTDSDDEDDYDDDDSPMLNYFIQWQGRTKLLAQVGGELVKSATVTLPDVSQKFALVYNKKKSQMISQSDMLMVYKQQLDKGTQASISHLNRADAIKNQKKAIKQLESYVQQKCGKKIPMSVSWPTVSNQFLINYSVSSYCGAPLNDIAGYCDFATSDKDAANMKKAILKKVNRVQCQVGKKNLGVSLAKGGALVWVTVADVDNQDDFFKYNLQSLLSKS